jgi:AbrB family looped-hinge helix DNA binding protein
MKTVTVSSRFRITLPLELRRLLNIQPGQKLDVHVRGRYIELLPWQAMTAARGFLRAIDTQIMREKDRA